MQSCQWPLRKPWQRVMTTQHSQQCARFLHDWQSAYQLNKPPIQWPPGSEEQANNQESLEEQWGHQLGKKQPDTIWLVLQNVDSIPNNMKQGDIKLDCLQAFTIENDIDILAITELNTAWDCLHFNKQWPAKTQGWWEANHWSMSHNKKDAHGDDFQLGGTALWVMNNLSHKMTRLGDDPSSLGCWCWARLCSKENHFLRVVSAYGPCKADGPHNLSTTSTVVFKTRKNVCPCHQILEDLKEQVETWQNEGDTVILLLTSTRTLEKNPSIQPFDKWGCQK